MIPEETSAPPPDTTSTDALRPRRSGFVSVLANPAFLRLWMAQAISQTAQQTINYTLLIQVRRIIEAEGQLGLANTATATMVLMFAMPPIFFSAVAGVIVDRSDKRQIMAGVNLARALCIAGYLLLQPGWPLVATLIYIYALCFIFSSVGQFFGPAEGSTIPLLVSRDQLLSANSLFSLTFIGSQLLGFITLGPLLASYLGLETVYRIVVALYLFCAVLIFTLPKIVAARDAAAVARRSMLGDIREVLVYIRNDRLLRKGIAYLTVANSAFLMLVTLAPEFVIAALNLTADRLPTIIGPAGLGMVIGVITVGRIGRHLNRERLLDRALIGVSVVLLCFALLPGALDRFSSVAIDPPGLSLPVLVAMVLATGLGIGNAFLIVPSQTLLQERSNEQIRARVLSAFFTTSNAVALIPILFAGVLGDIFGVVRVLVAIALLTLAIGVAAERAHWRQGRQGQALDKGGKD
jgi:MFS family permease